MVERWPHHTLPALTIWQPWATLIIAGLKAYEFRGYPAPRFVRGHRIAIHAGARPVRKAEIEDLLTRLGSDGDAWTAGLWIGPSIDLLERVHLSPGILPLSSVLGTVIIGTPIRAAEITDLGMPIADSNRVDEHKWGWPLHSWERFDVPVPARGAQGFWRWRRETLDG
jgi:hypothetical protein